MLFASLCVLVCPSFLWSIYVLLQAGVYEHTDVEIRLSFILNKQTHNALTEMVYILFFTSSFPL
jgi:hypothetical protein